jgi:hypothetical protein
MLHYRWEGPLPSATDNEIKGLRSKTLIRRNADAQGYGVTRPDVLSPTQLGTTVMTYSKSGRTAGVGFKDRKTRCLTLGFPFESITSDRDRDKLMKAIIRYLTEN